MPRCVLIMVGLLIGAVIALVHATNTPAFRLPYIDGETFIVSQGYHAPPTHIHKDDYALDFAKLACEAYGRPAIATLGGTVLLAQEAGFNGGYGAQALIEHADGLISRYAHLVAGSIAVQVGEAIAAGTQIGEIGDTGLVSGDACANHPGTHLHFAVYMKESDGTYAAYKPEPLSGYHSIVEGDWYEARKDWADAGAAGQYALTTLDGGVVAGAFMSEADLQPTTPTVADLGTPALSHESSGPLSPFEGTSSVASLPPPLSLSMPIASVPIGGVSAFSGGGGSAPALNIETFPADSFIEASSSPTSSTGQLNTMPNETSSSPTKQTSSTQSEGTTSVASSTASSSENNIFVLQVPTPVSGAGTIGVWNADALAINFAWQAPVNASGSVEYSIFDTSMASGSASSGAPLWVGTSTSFSLPVVADGVTHLFALQVVDSNGASSTAMTSVAVPAWFAILQPDKSSVSKSSWYSDTWYDLGTGFYGTIRSITLEGAVTPSPYSASHIWLDEFLDADYTCKNQSFIISDDAPFIGEIRPVAIGGLNISLQPNKYYRLNGYNAYQNRSLIFAGTNATGTAMWNGFIPGIGRIDNQYAFYPYLAWTFIPNWPPLAPPNPPPGVSASFDSTDSAITISWEAAMDSDTSSSLLTYEYAAAVASTTDDVLAWQPVDHSFSARVPVSYPNAYRVAVRARDDLGNVSAPAVVLWSFPDGYVPLPSQTDHSGIINGDPEKFHLYATTTITSIGLWTAFPGSNIYRMGLDSIEIHADAGGTPGALLGTSNLTPAGLSLEVWHGFPTPLVLPPGDYWLVRGPQEFAGAFYYGNSQGEIYFRLRAP